MEQSIWHSPGRVRVLLDVPDRIWDDDTLVGIGQRLEEGGVACAIRASPLRRRRGSDALQVVVRFLEQPIPASVAGAAIWAAVSTAVTSLARFIKLRHDADPGASIHVVVVDIEDHALGQARVFIGRAEGEGVDELARLGKQLFARRRPPLP